jgi:hypothetical protein
MRVANTYRNNRRKLEGLTIGSWFVQTYLTKSNYACKCQCGQERVIASRTLLGGDSRSCGKPECKRLGAKSTPPARKPDPIKYD